MSACPVPVPITHNICKVPASIFESLLDLCDFTALKCLLLILNRTVGLAAIGRGRTWAEIEAGEFAEFSRTTQEWSNRAIEFLEKAGFIQVHYVHGKASRPEYSISPDLAKEARGLRIQGKCKECQTVGNFATEFIPVPRNFIFRLAPALDHVTFLIVAVVCRYSHEHQWTTETGLTPQFVTLDRADFSRLTGLEAKQISTGIKNALKLGLIERVGTSGRAPAYRTCPENWNLDQRRELRVVNQPCENKAKEPKEKAAETPVKPANTHVIESGPRRYGFCAQCCRITEVEAVTDLVLASHEQEQQQKHPPPPKKPPEKARSEKGWDVLRRWFENARSKHH